MISLKMFFIYIAMSFHVIAIRALQCTDENNNSVEWYYVYKLPEKTRSEFYQNKNSGGQYTFLTSNSDGMWTLSNLSLLNEDNIISNTLAPLYANSDNLLHILYNDESPDGKKNEYKGHTKGVVLANELSGIWLIHSVPRFPQPEKYDYPETGETFGQSFLCLSLDLENLNKVGLQLQYNEINVYSKNIFENVKNQVPQLVDAANGKLISSPPWYHIENITTLHKTDFISFAKSRQFDDELYSSLVAPTLRTNLWTETWLNGRGKLPSNCSGVYWVKNIKSISLTSNCFDNTKDHSKWAVSSKKQQWLCVGDINREEHQEQRGGGTVCINSKRIATAYRSVVSTIENCST